MGILGDNFRKASLPHLAICEYLGVTTPSGNFQIPGKEIEEQRVYLTVTTQDYLSEYLKIRRGRY